MNKDWRELAQQLLTLPGSGPAGILADYFGASAQLCTARPGELERWRLVEGGELGLERDGTLVHDAGSGRVIARIEGFVAVAGLSPLALVLAGLAGGLVAGDKTLKACAPRLMGQARELLLVASCRLCG